MRPYLVRLVASDFAAAAVAATFAFLIRMPEGNGSAQAFSHHYVPFSLALPFLWLAALTAADAFDKRILSVGPDEFQRVGRALLVMMALIGFGSYALQANVARGYVVIAIPLAAALTLGGRYLVRKHLHRARIRGEVRTAVVAVGDAEAVADLATRMHAESYIGMRVVGACIPRRELTD
nr:sugar transferase [Actinomycetota bacterium]